MDNRITHSFDESSYSIDLNGRCSIEETRDRVMERHLRGDMSPKEDAAFIEHLLDCTACSRELQFREALQKELQKEPLDKALSSKVESSNVVKSRRAFLKYYVAAAVLLCISSWLFWVNTQPDPVWGNLALLQPGDQKPLILQGTQEQTLQDYNSALQTLIDAQPKRTIFTYKPYSPQQHQLAIKAFEDLFEEDLSADIRSDIGFYLFKSYLLMNEPEIALDWLEKSILDVGNSYKRLRAKIYTDEMDQRIDAYGSEALRLTDTRKRDLIESLMRLNDIASSGAINQSK